MKKFIINGRFLNQRVTGVQRVAIELTKQLDSIVEKGRFIIVAPPGAVTNLELYNIETIVIGKKDNFLWSQWILPRYAKKNGRHLITFSGLCALLKPDYFFVHDVTFIRYPQSFSKKFRLVYDYFFRMVLKRCQHIFTVSEFSQKEISNVYGIDSEQISVIYNASFTADNNGISCDILNKFEIEKNNYFLSVGSLNIHKNQKYIYEIAKKYPEETFVIVGGRTPQTFICTNQEPEDNLIFTGYVSDAELYGLYKYTKGFIFPSLYEGFGIPPLEAVMMGTKRIALSNIEVFKEVYPVGCYFFDPHDVNDFSVDSFCNHELTEDELYYYREKYSWEISAKKLLNIINSK